MRDYIQTHLHIALHLAVIALALIIGAWFANYSNRTIEAGIREQTMRQREELFSLAEITDRNGADDTIAQIVADCTRRDEYESLLVKLGSLTQKDLITVQNLFERCGTFYAERKALMVSRLSREFEVLTNLNTLLATLHAHTIPEKELSEWNELIVLERKRSQLLTDQSAIQAKIITALISGSTARSGDVTAFVQDAQQIAELLVVQDHQIDDLRASLKK